MARKVPRGTSSHDDRHSGEQPVKVEPTERGARFRVRAQPRASRTELAGEYGDAVRIRLAAPPVDGEANAELIRYLAKLLRVPKSAITILSGDSGRDKRVEVDGVDADAVRVALGDV